LISKYSKAIVLNANPIMSFFSIRAMREEDLDFAAAGTAAEGWTTETRQEFEAFLAYDPAGCFVAEWEGRRAGTCIAIRYGGQGFLGEMIVARELRTKGLGRPLFTRAMAYLLDHGCHAISLDAVPRAVPFYESMGFRAVCRSLRVYGALAAPPSPSSRPMTAADLGPVCALDRRAFGDDRSFFLRRRFDESPDLALVQERAGRIDGYVFGRRRGPVVWLGPLWAREADAGRAASLLQDAAVHARAPEIRMGVLELNARAAGLVGALGLAVKPHPSVRMIHGDVRRAAGLSLDLYAIGTAAKG